MKKGSGVFFAVSALEAEKAVASDVEAELKTLRESHECLQQQKEELEVCIHVQISLFLSAGVETRGNRATATVAAGQGLALGSGGKGREVGEHIVASGRAIEELYVRRPRAEN